MIDELEARPGERVEPVAGEDGRSRREMCYQCDPPRSFGNLKSHQQQKHGAPKPRRDRPPKTPGAGGKLPSLRVELEATYMLIAGLWKIKDPVCGSVLEQMAPELAVRWDNYAQTNERVHQWVSNFMVGGGLFGVVAAHLPLAVIVVQHHGPAARLARAQAEAEMMAAAQAEAAGVDPGSYFPPAEAYGPYEPGSADAAR